MFIGALFLINLLTFIVYWFDKKAAQKQARRVPERTLHLLSLLGGWLGALVAQQKLRHKTQKQPFKSIFYLTILLNLMGVYFLSTQ